MKHLIAVGACYVDTILSVPHYPAEDEKLRATSLTKRRGGNCPNSLEVLQQLCSLSSTSHSNHDELDGIALVLASTLPSASSIGTAFIRDSFPQPEGSGFKSTDVTSYIIHRPDSEEPASSYIIKSLEAGSRTIVNYNDLPEMTLDEFEEKTERYIQRCDADKAAPANLRTVENTTNCLFWFHFEGRIPETTLACIQYLRDHPYFSHNNSPTKPNAQLKISVELEKPQRPGLFALAAQADVVFYSKSWAMGQGYKTAKELLRTQVVQLRESRSISGQSDPQILVCTWGEDGSAATCDHGDQDLTIIICPAWKDSTKQVVDTIGAGDTFIAGMLYRFLREDPNTDQISNLEAHLKFANELAGRKVTQEGFAGLGQAVKEELDLG